jgi:hypothetical protein
MERLVEHRERLGFVVMKKPALHPSACHLPTMLTDKPNIVIARPPRRRWRIGCSRK